jgi:hypothetical protein
MGQTYSQGKVLKFMQQVEFALSVIGSVIPTGCLSNERQVAVPCCRVYMPFCSRGGSHDIYELVQPQIIFNPIFFFITGIIYFSSFVIF